MSEQILCAIRGGPLSGYTIERAIELAKERGAKLVFLYVVDHKFLGYATVGRPRVILSELRRTGRFMMDIITERAKSQGLDADYVVRTGDVRRQIIEAVHFQNADLLVMGATVKKGRRSNAFTEKRLAEFVEEVEAKAGVEVVIAKRPEASEPEESS